MKNLAYIRKVPLNQLTPFDHWKLKVNELIVELREVVNEAKLRGYCCVDWRYRVGRIHGILYYTGAIITYNYWDMQELEDIREGVLNEVEYLTGAYLKGVKCL